jgi:hypothetical protein
MNAGRLPTIISASLLGFALTAGGVAMADSASADTVSHSTTVDQPAKQHKKPKLKHHKLKPAVIKHHKILKHKPEHKP